MKMCLDILKNPGNENNNNLSSSTKITNVISPKKITSCYEQNCPTPLSNNNDNDNDNNDIINNFMIIRFDNEYKKYSMIIHKLQNHIEKIADLKIIDYNGRSKYIKILNNIIKLLNLTYNDNLKELDSTSLKTNSFTDFILANHKSFGDNIYNYVNDLLSSYQLNNPSTVINSKKTKHSILDTIQEYNDQFNNIANVILKDICTKIGFNSIKQACELLNIKNYKNYDSELFDLYNNIFIPLNYNIIKLSGNKEIYLTTSTLKYDNFNEYGKLYLKINNDSYCTFDGYFKIDTLNIIRKTCQINYPYLFNKIKTVGLQLGDNTGKDTKNIPPEIFYKNYIKNSSIVPFIIHDVNTIVTIITKKYCEYDEIHSMTFSSLIEYIENIDESNIYKFSDIIKFILIKNRIQESMDNKKV